MPYKFERLEVWQLAVEYLDLLYDVAAALPRQEEYNLKSQLIRAGTSVALNIAEGSTGQSDAEQARFLTISVRSLVETVACQHVIRRRYGAVVPRLASSLERSERLFAKLSAMIRALRSSPPTRVAEDRTFYGEDIDGTNGDQQ